MQSSCNQQQQQQQQQQKHPEEQKPLGAIRGLPAGSCWWRPVYICIHVAGSPTSYSQRIEGRRQWLMQGDRETGTYMCNNSSQKQPKLPPRVTIIRAVPARSAKSGMSMMELGSCRHRKHESHDPTLQRGNVAGRPLQPLQTYPSNKLDQLDKPRTSWHLSSRGPGTLITEQTRSSRSQRNKTADHNQPLPPISVTRS